MKRFFELFERLVVALEVIALRNATHDAGKGVAMGNKVDFDRTIALKQNEYVESQLN